MSVSAVAPTPFYQDPDRLQIGLPQSGDGKAAIGSRAEDSKLSMFGAEDGEPSFWDLLDVINPLQHIPVIGNIYRELTGDQIGVGARVAGGALFGGPIGLIASAVDCMVEESSGKDVGGHMLALFRDDDSTPPSTAPATQFAQAASPAAATAVSSSPAKAAADGGPGGAAPVIALPESEGGRAAQPMVFSLEGMQVATPAPANANANTTALPVETAAATATAKPMPLIGTPARTLPTPPRNLNATAAPMPPVTVPVSTSSARSNTPITGRSPQAANVAAAQRAMVTQEKLANHPMLPPTDANGQTAAAPDWFSNAWGQALDKYQRANQRNDKSNGSSTTTSTLE